MHLSLSRPTHPRSSRDGDLQELFDKFPTPGDDFMLQISYYRIAGFCREDFNLAIGSIRDIKIRGHFIRDIL